MQQNNLPSNWSWVDLETVCEKITDGTHNSPKSTTSGYPYVTVKDIIDDRVDFDNCKRISEEDFNKFSKGDCSPQLYDVLLSKDGTVGKTTIIDFDKNFVILSSLAILRPNLDLIIPHHLFYFIKSNHFLNQAMSIKKGVALRRIILRDIKKLQIPLPPLPEQHKIVEKIEELFSELDNGIDNLKKAKAQIKTYRQAVLKSAFEGKLVQGKGQEAKGKSKNGELPDGWEWIKLENLTTKLGDGLHGTPKYSESGEYFFINGNNLSDGKIEIKENTKRVTKVEFEKYKKPLNESTVFVSINGTLGKTAFYNGEKIILGKSACYFNVSEKLNKQFIRYFLKSQQFLNYANKIATGSTIKNVSLKAMRELLLPLPHDICVQTQIVEEIEKRFSVTEKMEAAIDESLKKSEALRQSILKQAFEGKLV